MIIVGELPQGGKVGPGTSTTMKKVLGNFLLKLHNIKNWGAAHENVSDERYFCRN